MVRGTRPDTRLGEKRARRKFARLADRSQGSGR
jgi:hypothetical protein